MNSAFLHLEPMVVYGSRPPNFSRAMSTLSFLLDGHLWPACFIALTTWSHSDTGVAHLFSVSGLHTTLFD